MSLSCLRSFKPNISHVDRLYDPDSEDGHMYSGNGTPLLCSSTHPPAPSGCRVCSHQFVYAVCSNLLKNVKLVMEGGGQPIDLIESECPGLFGTNGNADLSGDDTGASKWWLLLLLLLLLLVVMIFPLVAVIRKHERNNLEGVESAVDSSEVEPDAESIV